MLATVEASGGMLNQRPHKKLQEKSGRGAGGVVAGSTNSEHQSQKTPTLEKRGYSAKQETTFFNYVPLDIVLRGNIFSQKKLNKHR